MKSADDPGQLWNDDGTINGLTDNGLESALKGQNIVAQGRAGEPDRRPGSCEAPVGVRANRLVSRRHWFEDAIQPRIDFVLEQHPPVHQVLRSDNIVVALPTQGGVRPGGGTCPGL